jgi:hypothetical protein
MLSPCLCMHVYPDTCDAILEEDGVLLTQVQEQGSTRLNLSSWLDQADLDWIAGLGTVPFANSDHSSALLLEAILMVKWHQGQSEPLGLAAGQLAGVRLL